MDDNRYFSSDFIVNYYQKNDNILFIYKVMKQKLKFLNGLRGMAALFVFIAHGGYLAELPMGSIGVDIFFVLSSFLLTGILYQKFHNYLEERKCKKDWLYTLLNYFFRRFMRVYPLFAVIAIVLGLVSSEVTNNAFHTKGVVYWIPGVLSFSFNYRFHVFWTLPLEMEYYCIIPVFVAIVIFSRRFWWVVCTIILLVSLYISITIYHDDHQTIVPHLPSFIDGSLASILCFKIRYGKRENISKRTKVIMDILVYVILVVSLGIVGSGLIDLISKTEAFKVLKGNSYVAPPLSFVLFKETLWPGPVSRFLELNFFMFCGKISYPLYLTHPFPIYFWGSIEDYYKRLIVLLSSSILIASILHYLIEFPVQKATSKVSAYLQSKQCKNNCYLNPIIEEIQLMNNSEVIYI